jgi:hypothetical protein
VKLYCFACNELHQFTETAAERVIYTLQALAADMAISERQPGDAEDHTLCLQEIQRHSYDAEGYLEWTSGLQEKRRENGPLREAIAVEVA